MSNGSASVVVLPTTTITTAFDAIFSIISSAKIATSLWLSWDQEGWTTRCPSPYPNPCSSTDLPEGSIWIKSVGHLPNTPAIVLLLSVLLLLALMLLLLMAFIITPTPALLPLKGSKRGSDPPRPSWGRGGLLSEVKGREEGVRSPPTPTQPHQICQICHRADLLEGGMRVG